MANEIKALEGDGEGLYRVLFLYAIDDPESYTDGAGTTVQVVPTPAPTEGIIASVLSLTETAALDAGDAAYEVVSYGPSPEKTGPDLVAELQALYADRKAAFLDSYASRYKYLGTEVDA